MKNIVTRYLPALFPGLLLINLLLASLLLGGCDTSMLKLSGSENAAAKSEQASAELRNEADGYYQQKNFAAALPLYQQLNDAFPEDAQLWLRTGNSLARMNRYDEAIDSYRKAVAADPQLAIAWHNMGVLQLRQTARTFNRMAGSISNEDPLHPLAVKMSAATQQLLGIRQENK